MSDKVSYVTSKLNPTKWAGLFVALFVGLFSCSTSQPVHGLIPTTLVLGLDGIPFQTFKKLQDGGHFRNFFPVAPMVASFPSISDPNWSLLMGLGPEMNFTKAFFDPTIKTDHGMGEKNGSIMAHISREPRYERIMDFNAEGAWQHLAMFIWTDTTGHYWLQSLIKKFFDFSGRDTYFALMVNTDILSHTEGEMPLMKYLVEIEDTVNKIQSHYKELYGRDLNVVLISDHGNYFTSPQDVPFVAQLPPMGWDLAPTISGPKDVGYYVPEMLGFGAFYCQQPSSRKLAQDFSKIDGVHVGIYMVNSPSSSSNEIRVFSDHGRGEAKISYNEKEGTVFFKVLKGNDPFDQAKLFKNGPLKKKDYFTKTLDSIYPNALVRIWEGFKINSKIQPQVLVDTDLGYVFGNKTLRLMTELRGFASTHGSLRREDSLGIFTSTQQPPRPLIPQEFGEFVNVKELSKGNAE